MENCSLAYLAILGRKLLYDTSQFTDNVLKTQYPLTAACAAARLL